MDPFVAGSVRGGWVFAGRAGGTTPPGAIRESPLQEILAGVAGAGHPCSESGTWFRTNRSCRLAPAHQGMKTGGAHSSHWIPAEAGITVALRRPHKRMKIVGRRAFACCMAVLPHSPPLLDSGLRRNDEWEAVGTVYPGSGSGTCFRSNRSCRLVPAHQGVKIGCIGWWESSSVIATTRTSPLDSRLRGNDELRGRDDEIGE